jgi:predicted heme/steroid binding protein
MSIKNISRFLLLFLVITVISFSVACSDSDSSDNTETSDSESSDSVDENESDEDTESTEEDTSDEDSEMSDEDTESSEEKIFTEDELATYNGKDGNPAYVAIDGVVYDVTNSDEWNDGEHKNGVTAGQDLTDELGSSPHGDSVLGDLPVVGSLE